MLGFPFQTQVYGKYPWKWRRWLPQLLRVLATESPQLSALFGTCLPLAWVPPSYRSSPHKMVGHLQQENVLASSVPRRTMLNDHPIFRTSCGIMGPLTQHSHHLPAPVPFLHKYWSQESFIMNFLPADFHLWVCFLGHPTWDIMLSTNFFGLCLNYFL